MRWQVAVTHRKSLINASWRGFFVLSVLRNHVAKGLAGYGFCATIFTRRSCFLVKSAVPMGSS